MNKTQRYDDATLPYADATLEMLDTSGTLGAICALLAPLIKAELKGLAPGQVLLVRVDDPSAWLDVQAWCDLTGNDLQAALEQDGIFSFFIRKQNKQQEV